MCFSSPAGAAAYAGCRPRRSPRLQPWAPALSAERRRSGDDRKPGEGVRGDRGGRAAEACASCRASQVSSSSAGVELGQPIALVEIAAHLGDERLSRGRVDPSATTRSPRSWARVTVARTMVESAGFVAIRNTKDWSILTWRAGSLVQVGQRGVAGARSHRSRGALRGPPGLAARVRVRSASPIASPSVISSTRDPGGVSVARRAASTRSTRLESAMSADGDVDRDIQVVGRHLPSYAGTGVPRKPAAGERGSIRSGAPAGDDLLRWARNRTSGVSSAAVLRTP